MTRIYTTHHPWLILVILPLALLLFGLQVGYLVGSRSVPPAAVTPSSTLTP